MIKLSRFRMKLRQRSIQFNSFRKENTYSENSHDLPEIDWKLIVLNPDFYKQLLRERRQSASCEIVDEVLNLWRSISDRNSKLVIEKIVSLCSNLPNTIHPAVRNYNSDFVLVSTYGQIKTFDFKPVSATDLLQEKNLLKMNYLNLYTGEKSYYFIKCLAKLEQALINYTVKNLLKRGFELLSVPDILPQDVIEKCGMPNNERTQVYQLGMKSYGNLCLSGTAEFAIAAFLKNSNLKAEQIPKLYTAVSRCYRAEVSRLASEKGIYRVHQFNKVEMFGVCHPSESESLLEKFLQIQEDLFRPLNFHYRVIDMAAHELGHHAYRKYDIEAWMPGMNRYGEISSCSNCIDFQSRRLHICTGSQFLHTVNGTACALPRMISAIVENHQTEEGRVIMPEILQPFLGFNILGMNRGPNISRIMNSNHVMSRKWP